MSWVRSILLADTSFTIPLKTQELVVVSLYENDNIETVTAIYMSNNKGEFLLKLHQITLT